MQKKIYINGHGVDGWLTVDTEHVQHVLHMFVDDDKAALHVSWGGVGVGQVLHVNIDIDDDEWLISEYGEIVTAEYVKREVEESRRKESHAAR